MRGSSPCSSFTLCSCLALVLLFPFACPVRGATALGDHGHFLSYWPKTHLGNPEGRAFSVTLHFMVWPIDGWNKKSVWLRVTDPAGAVISWKQHEVEDNRVALRLPAGRPGAYTFEPGAKQDGRFEGGNFWLESDLDHSVVWTGNAASSPEDRENAIEKRRAVFQCSVPRRWWFWVPPETNTFTARAQRADRYMSQREDWGLSFFSPRGQPPKTKKPYRGEMVARVEVEPGAAGRFWMVEVRHGDSHHHSNINLCLDGVPPYLARSPEEWFDPAAPGLPAVPLYDDTPFVQAAYAPQDLARWPALQHWSPCPSLGDPDGTEIRGDGSFALWNPENRPLRYMVGDYLPRNALGKGAAPPEARVVLSRADGEALLEATVPVPHYHGHGETPRPLPETGPTVCRFSVSGAERWWAFTYPATPLVWLGVAQDGWAEYSLEVGGVRHWYFRVPPGCRSFAVRFAAAHETDRLDLEINAPDRVVERLYGRRGEVVVEVPAGLDGRLWHLRTDVGSGSRLVTSGTGATTRYLGIHTTLGMRGVPPCLAPTWEQWFDPARPVAPLER